jgi:micrococcal nuclease
MIAPSYTYPATIVRVVDGDTYDAEIDLGFRIKSCVRLRLGGVDTPETFGVKRDSEEYANGVRARTFVEDWLADCELAVWVRTRKTGKYGRWIAEVYRTDDPVGLAEALLEAGLAELDEG